jgi:CheY-like chemotaxis protein
MFDKKRILVVEDEDDLRGPYRRCLERRGFNVDEAPNFDAATLLINAKSYHVAIVDVMLGGRGVFNLDGLKVLQVLKELDEGTKPIVLSSQTDTQVTANSLQEYGAFRYLKKDIISTEGLDRLAEVVIETLTICKLITFGEEYHGRQQIEKRALIFLVGEQKNESLFVDRCLRTLKPKGGYTELETFLHSFIVRLTPLMLPIGKKEFAIVDENAKIIYGSFWSKAVGVPITIVISGHKNLDNLSTGQIKPEWNELNEIKEARYTDHNLCGLVFKLIGAQRSEFLHKLSEK